MKTLLLYILLLALCPSVGAEQWPKGKFSYVVAYCYDYTQDKRGYSIIQKDGLHHSGIISPATKRLSKDEIAILRNILSKKAEKEENQANQSDCFWPHHAFVFYDEKWKPEAYISICLTCGTFQEEPDGVELWLDVAELQKFIKELKLPVFKYSSPREKSQYTRLFERTERSEQAGADEPATAPESKPKNKENPKPESEVSPQ